MNLYDSTGLHRPASAAETLARLRSQLGGDLGRLRDLKRLETDAANPVQVFQAQQSAVGVTGEGLWRHRRHPRGFIGSGTTAAQARVCALGEAIERVSGVFRGTERRVAASMKELGDTAVHPNSCMRFSDRQYRNRESWNRWHSHVNWVPNVLDQERTIEWTPLASRTREEPRYLPTSYCYYDYPEPPERLYGLADSNGCAAGSSIEEAILHGLLEVVERDSVAIWWYNMLRRPGIELAGFETCFFGEVREHHHSLGRDVWALDLTSDLGIPVVAACSRRAHRERGDLLLGFGAHLCLEGAAYRALVELGLSLAVASSAGSVRVYSDEPPGLGWLESGGSVSARRGGGSSRQLGDPADDLARCVELLDRQGLEVLVLDQTRPGMGLNVAKVVVPGLRSWWARFAPGRLYDVPVELGWLERPLEEARLNPSHLYL